MPIRRLPTLLVNQIAAGEVIERPASVVKELVENSIDAGATRIDVVIEEGGLQLIRVSDDACGIPADELLLAIAPHATSKLQTPDQLGNISTMGFRGEALASIASVSRLRITSRLNPRLIPGADESGAALEASGDDVVGPMPAAAAPGTVIEVRELFFNTPARRKFMRGAPVEFGHINETLCRIAMAHPEVAFSLVNNGRRAMDLAATDSQRRRCVEVLGKELDAGLIEFKGIERARSIPAADVGEPAESPATVWGLAGVPSIARATSKFQYLCLNGRPIKDRNLTHAIKEAYRGLIPPDKHPVTIVFVDIDPTAVDVNVHPAKSEVRFREPSRLHGLVLSAIRQQLLGTDLTPSAQLLQSSAAQRTPWDEAVPSGTEPSTPIVFPAMAPQVPSNAPATPVAQPPLQAGPFRAGSTPTNTAPPPSPQWHAPPPSHAPTHPNTPAQPVTVASFVDYFRRMDPRQKGFAYQQVKEALRTELPEAMGESAAMFKTDNEPAKQPIDDEYAAVPAPLRTMGVLQIHDSYLVTQDEKGLVIVDQHALHERVMFEELRRRVLSNTLESQRLLMPAVVPAAARRQALIEPLKPLLDRLGIECEPIGKDAVAIHAFPSFLFDRKVDPIVFIQELLDRAEEGELSSDDATSSEAALHEVLDMMACKAAVKAGDKLSVEELAALLARRDETERSSNCPHGRPTTIRLTLRDLEKYFKRA